MYVEDQQAAGMYAYVDEQEMAPMEVEHHFLDVEDRLATGKDFPGREVALVLCRTAYCEAERSLGNVCE